MKVKLFQAKKILNNYIDRNLIKISNKLTRKMIKMINQYNLINKIYKIKMKIKIQNLLIKLINNFFKNLKFS